MEVETGQIKAMVKSGQKPRIINMPRFIIMPLMISGVMTLGLLSKTASMMALFEDTTLTLRDTIETGGGQWRYYERVYA